MSDTAITLAVVTYNQAAWLAGFLARYRRFGVHAAPLLVVDDGSTDDTPRLLGEAEAELPLCLLVHRIAHGGSARARNQALRQCPTPWIAFSDTDCVLDAAYFRLLPEIPRRYAGFAAVEGAVVPPPGNKPPFTHSLFNPAGGTYATANMAFRVADALESGGFDEGFPENLREDADLALTLLESKGAIPFCPEWQVCHPHVPRRFWPALRQAWRRHDRMLRAEVRLYRKHPQAYGRLRHHADALATLRNWCWHWSWLYVRECLAALAGNRRGRSQSAWAVWRSCGAAILVAGWEQVCIAFWCLRRWKTLSRPGPA